MSFIRTSFAKSLRLVGRHNVDLSDDPVRLRPGEIDRKQSIGQISAQNLHAVGKEKGTLELTGGDAAMQEVPGLVIDLAPPDNELFFFQGHLKLIPGESCHRESDAQTFGEISRSSQP